MKKTGYRRVASLTWVVVAAWVAGCDGAAEGDEESWGVYTGSPAGNGGPPATGGLMSPGTGGVAGDGDGAGDGGGSGGTDQGPVPTPPANCAEAQAPYELVQTPLDASFVAAEADRGWGGEYTRVPVAVDASGGVYVGFTRDDGGGRSAVIVPSDGGPGEMMSAADAVLGRIATTADGVAALLFDPNSDQDARTWAAVARFGADGQQTFRTDLFHSPNLDDVGTKGGAGSGRLAYLAQTDTLVPYFGHTQRYDDGVRHQGGYLATLDAGGAQTVLSGWYGSHNLSQRLLVDGSRVALLGLGDAYPKGIFFGRAEDRPRSDVIYLVAADGLGTSNAKLGGMVDLGDDIAVPFITNRSVAQDLDPGPWDNSNEAVAMQIRQGAAAGTDLGLLRVPKAGLPGGDLSPLWIDAQPTPGARLDRLKSALYAPGMLLLVWAEVTGDTWNETSTFFSMVIDGEGAICQAKTALPAGAGLAGGDDLVAAPDGSILWANADGGGITLVRLLP